MENDVEMKIVSPAAQLVRVERLLHGAEHFEAFYAEAREGKQQP